MILSFARSNPVSGGKVDVFIAVSHLGLEALVGDLERLGGDVRRLRVEARAGPLHRHRPGEGPLADRLPVASEETMQLGALVKIMLNVFTSGSTPDSIMCWR